MTQDNYIEESKKLHQTSKGYGSAKAYQESSFYKSRLGIAEAIEHINSRNKFKIDSVLDYGTGKGGLVTSLSQTLGPKINIQGYDPSMPQFATKPNQKFKLITCIDVLEHIDRNSITQILNDIKSLNQGIFFYVIDLIPAQKSLSDGRNAHIMLAPPDWWSQQLSSIFPININFKIGKVPDGSDYPIRFIGCSANDIYYLDIAADFLKGTKLFQQQWILNSDGNSMSIAVNKH